MYSWKVPSSSVETIFSGIALQLLTLLFYGFLTFPSSKNKNEDGEELREKARSGTNQKGPPCLKRLIFNLLERHFWQCFSLFYLSFSGWNTLHCSIFTLRTNSKKNLVVWMSLPWTCFLLLILHPIIMMMNTRCQQGHICYVIIVVVDIYYVYIKGTSQDDATQITWKLHASGDHEIPSFSRRKFFFLNIFSTLKKSGNRINQMLRNIINSTIVLPPRQIKKYGLTLTPDE